MPEMQLVHFGHYLFMQQNNPTFADAMTAILGEILQRAGCNIKVTNVTLSLVGELTILNIAIKV
jgi:hypothetical protein